MLFQAMNAAVSSASFWNESPRMTRYEKNLSELSGPKLQKEYSGVYDSGENSPYELGAIVYELAYVIEEISTQHCKLTLYSREDIKGKSPEWYLRVWDYECCRHLLALRESFLKPISKKCTK